MFLYAQRWGPWRATSRRALHALTSPGARLQQRRAAFPEDFAFQGEELANGQGRRATRGHGRGGIGLETALGMSAQATHAPIAQSKGGWLGDRDT